MLDIAGRGHEGGHHHRSFLGESLVYVVVAEVGDILLTEILAAFFPNVATGNFSFLFTGV